MVTYSYIIFQGDFTLDKLHGAALIGQSGSPTAAINATLCGAVRALINDKKNGGQITAIYGMKNGIEGFLKEDIINLFDVFDGDCDDKKLKLLSTTPAAALGSCRKKLPNPDSDSEFFENLISLFKKYDIRYFFYIGGNDSMDTVAKLSAYTAKCDYQMRIVGLPKTIDNDLCGTDHTPGYASCAKYVATTLQEICFDCAVYTVPAVTIVEIMGRDAGWLTASAGIPKLYGTLYPDLIYLPEVSFSLDDFLCDVNQKLAEKPKIVVAVSEGIRMADGTYVCEIGRNAGTDVFGHKALTGTGKALELYVKDKIGCKVRSVELNISQRCASHISSATDIGESIEVGEKGVLCSLEGKSGFMMAIIRNDCDNYSVSYVPMDVSEIANKVRAVPREFINERGNYVTDECIKYLKPLIEGEVEIPYENGLPKVFTF